MSEQDWEDANWAADAVAALLRRVLRNISRDFAMASVTLQLPDWHFRTNEPKR